MKQWLFRLIEIRTILFILCALSPFDKTLKAQEEFKGMTSPQTFVRRDLKENTTHYLAFYADENQWKVELFSKRDGSFQVKEKSFFFANEKDAEHKLIEELRTNSWLTPNGKKIQTFDLDSLKEDRFNHFDKEIPNRREENRKEKNESPHIGSKIEAMVGEMSFLVDSPQKQIQNEKGIAILTENNQNVLWKSTKKWDLDQISRYKEWVSNTIQTYFLQKHNIPTDCADLAFISWWIFARINGLPVAQQLVGSGDLLTNLSMRKEWLKLPTHKDWEKDLRFRAALEYLMDNTYTHTLLKDSYPIKISSEAFTAGVHHLLIRKRQGHTTFVYQVSPIVKVFSSNLPRIIRPLMDGLFFDQKQLTVEQGGFMRFRWPEIYKENGIEKVRITPAEQMPYYSLEQFDPSFLPTPNSHFAFEINRRLNPDFDPQKLILDFVDDLVIQLNNRVEVVRDGYKSCPNRSCKEGTQQYEDWSTPERDLRIVKQSKAGWDLFQNLLQLIADNEKRENFQKIIKDRLDQQYIDLDLVEINGTKTNKIQKVSLYSLLFIFQNDLFSSDPNDPPENRWGWGVQALHTNIKNKFESLYLGERAQRISLRKKLCPTKDSCPIGSDSWNQTQTFEMDHKLRTWISVLNEGYCVEFPNNCEQSREWIRSHLILGKNRNELTEMVHLFHSTPEMDHHIVKPVYERSVHSSSKQLQRSSDGQLLQGLPLGNFIYNSEDFIVYPSNPNLPTYSHSLMSSSFNLFVQVNLEPDDSTSQHSDHWKFTIRNSKLQVKGTFELQKEPINPRIRWSNGKETLLWVRSEKQLFAYKPDGSLYLSFERIHKSNESEVTLENPPDQNIQKDTNSLENALFDQDTSSRFRLSTLVPKYEWVRGRQNQLQLLDTDTLEVKTIFWTPTLSTALLSVNENDLILLQTKDRVDPQFFETHKNLKIGIYNFNTHQIKFTPLPEIQITQWIGDHLFLAKVNPSNGFSYFIIAKISTELEVLLQFRPSEFSFWVEPSSLIVAFGSDGTKAFHVNASQDQVKEVLPNSDEKGVFYLDSNIVYSITKDQKYRIRTTSGQILFETQHFIYFLKNDRQKDQDSERSINVYNFSSDQFPLSQFNLFNGTEPIPFYTKIAQPLDLNLKNMFGPPNNHIKGVQFVYDSLVNTFGQVFELPSAHSYWLSYKKEENSNQLDPMKLEPFDNSYYLEL